MARITGRKIWVPIGFAALFAIAAGLVWLAIAGQVKIANGHIGILSKRFSGTQSGFLPQGSYWFAPWNNVYEYDARPRQNRAIYNVMNVRGIACTIYGNISWQITPDQAWRLHQEIGPDYPDTVIMPEFGAQLRILAGNKSGWPPAQNNRPLLHWPYGRVKREYFKYARFHFTDIICEQAGVI